MNFKILLLIEKLSLNFSVPLFFIFEILDAPVIRVASLDTPIPFSEDIERDIYLPLSRIKDKINYLLEY